MVNITSNVILFTVVIVQNILGTEKRWIGQKEHPLERASDPLGSCFHSGYYALAILLDVPRRS